MPILLSLRLPLACLSTVRSPVNVPVVPETAPLNVPVVADSAELASCSQARVDSRLTTVDDIHVVGAGGWCLVKRQGRAGCGVGLARPRLLLDILDKHLKVFAYVDGPIQRKRSRRAVAAEALTRRLVYYR